VIYVLRNLPKETSEAVLENYAMQNFKNNCRGGGGGKSRGKGQAAAIKIDGRAKDKGACL